jgi:hypothetical protein
VMVVTWFRNVTAPPPLIVADVGSDEVRTTPVAAETFIVRVPVGVGGQQWHCKADAARFSS